MSPAVEVAQEWAALDRRRANREVCALALSQLRSELDRRRALRAAAVATDLQAAERHLEREADAEIRQSRSIIAASVKEREMMREQAIARRRESLARIMAYPMSGEDLTAACQHATLSAKVPATSFEDVSQALIEHVIRRHGPEPIRAKLGAGWLRQRAQAIHIDQERERERAMGSRATADALADWRKSDHRAAMADAAMNGDAVWQLAAQRPAPVDHHPISAEMIARRLAGISSGQAQALAVAINTRHVRPLSSTERVQWLNARRNIRQRYPDTGALLLAIRPSRYAAELLTDAAIKLERRLADVTSRGC